MCLVPHLSSCSCITPGRSVGGVLLPQHFLRLLQHIHLRGMCAAHHTAPVKSVCWLRCATHWPVSDRPTGHKNTRAALQGIMQCLAHQDSTVQSVFWLRCAAGNLGKVSAL
jgi:hypothetical protein